MIIQVAGLVLTAVALGGAALYLTSVRKTKLITESRERMQRAENDQRTFEFNAIRMYENERQARIAAETKVGILQHQLKRAREQMDKVKIGK